HNDKPFFTAALRIGVIGAGDYARDMLRSLAPFASLFQHGGRPLRWIDDTEYSNTLTPTQIQEMFTLSRTHRAGFLVNSWELAGLVHIPPAAILEFRRIPVQTLETLPVKNPDLEAGLRIGTCVYANEFRPVCIPDDIRSLHIQLLGRPGMGKSTVAEHMTLGDIDNGHGVAVIDPHGDLIERLLRLIPEKHIDRIVYFNPGDPDWVPLWNPLKKIPGQDDVRTANDLVGSIKSVVTGWGDRLESLLRYAFLAAFSMEGKSFRDVADLLRRGSKESNALRKELYTVVQNEAVLNFWRYDFEGYRKEELSPPQHKLSKLLASGTVALMLSKSSSLIDLRRIMDEGMILLVDLSSLDSELRNLLGCFLLVLLHQAAISRSAVPPEERREFHIYADDAHRFVTDALEGIIAEDRKYKVSLTLAHQYLSQFSREKADAISTVGTAIIFNVDTRDAQYLKKDLRDMVEVKDIITLRRGQAIARIGTEIVRFDTLEPKPIPEKHFRERIIAECHRKYYKPASEVRAALRQRSNSYETSLRPLPLGSEEDFRYDEF
ncbi:MAG: type IV secretion system DNA-binding domain-containing protein, partial [bacterium]